MLLHDLALNLVTLWLPDPLRAIHAIFQTPNQTPRGNEKNAM